MRSHSSARFKIMGDKIGTQINHNQNLAQAAQDIKARIINALKEGGITALEAAIDHPAVKPVVE
jgi:predicted transcriptional regulator YheO